jgi:hypothetical protein
MAGRSIMDLSIVMLLLGFALGAIVALIFKRG